MSSLFFVTVTTSFYPYLPPQSLKKKKAKHAHSLPIIQPNHYLESRHNCSQDSTWY